MRNSGIWNGEWGLQGCRCSQDMGGAFGSGHGWRCLACPAVLERTLLGGNFSRPVRFIQSNDWALLFEAEQNSEQSIRSLKQAGKAPRWLVTICSLFKIGATELKEDTERRGNTNEEWEATTEAISFQSPSVLTSLSLFQQTLLSRCPRWLYSEVRQRTSPGLDIPR